MRYTCSLYHTDHIAPCLDPQILFNVFFFDFSWDDCNTKKKLEKMLMQFFGGRGRRGGVNKVRYTCSLCLCENGE